MSQVQKGLLFFGVIVVLVFALHVSGLLPSFTEIVTARDIFREKVMTMPFVFAALFFFFYILVVALSIPFATLLSLLAGYVFGTIIGTALVVVAATIGATIIFILARYFFRDAFVRAFASKLVFIEDELGTHGFRDILVLRLTPLIPFSLINIGAALTTTHLVDYILGTFIGIVPFAYLYVAAGVELGRIHSPSEIVSMDIIWQRSLLALVAFTLLYLGSYRKKISTTPEA